MPGFSLSFDPHSLKEIAAFAGFPVLMSNEVQGAMQQVGATLVASIQGNMHWSHPTGALEASIMVVNDSPYEIEVGSALPYSRRREFGFSGMVDSIGRYFPYDPGGYYFAAAAAQSSQEVLALIEAAVERALTQLGAP